MAAAGPKRARTNGSGGEGDWTCPQCGNVNFAFRATCNMRKCSCPKPVDFTQRGMGGPSYLQPMYEQSGTPRYVGGPGAPPALPLAMQSGYGANYGASYGATGYGATGYGATGYSATGYGAAGYGASMPLTAAPTPGLAYNYDYGLSVNTPAAYNSLALPPSYGPSGAAFGGGPGYSAGPVVDGYGVGINMGRVPHMPAILYPEENGARKRRGGPGSEGDWVCPKCGNTNFGFRETCNMRRCGSSKPTEPTSRQGNTPLKASEAPPPDGSWKCEKCENINYPFRTKCNRKSCNADRPSNPKSS